MSGHDVIVASCSRIKKESDLDVDLNHVKMTVTKRIF